MQKLKVYLKITLNPKNAVENTSKRCTYVLLLFTNKSWVLVDPLSFSTAGVATVSKLVNLTSGSGQYFNVQLYKKSNDGLGGRHSQMLVGASSLKVVHVQTGGKRNKFSQPTCFPLTLTDYFQRKREHNATCSISLALPNLKIVRSTIGLMGYSTKKHELTRRYRPSDAFLANLYMPYYFDENVQSLLPGSSFFFFPSFREASAENEWLEHFKKLIQRFDMQYARASIKNRSIEEVSAAFGVEPVYLLADALTETVTCYPYRPDKKESFDDVFFNHSGDCEDFAKGILRAWYELERTGKHARSKFLKSVVSLMQRYRPWAVLGAVKKRSFSTSDSVTTPREAGHMFAMLLPISHDAVCFSANVGSSFDSNLSGVILEGTARVSYLAGACFQHQVQVPHKPPYKTAYQLQPMTTDVTRLSSFYFQIVYLFTADPDLVKKYGARGFLVVNDRTHHYGVETKDVIQGSPCVRFVPDRSYEPKVKRYLESTYIQVQAQYQMGIPKLPLHTSVNKTLYGGRSTEGCLHGNESVYFVDVQSVKSEQELVRTTKMHGAKLVVQEDMVTYRIEL